MTTKVTIDAHAGWDVEVELIVKAAEGEEVVRVEIVNKNTIKDFYIHSGMRIGSVKELE